MHIVVVFVFGRCVAAAGPVTQPKVLPKVQVEERVSSLYDQAIQQKKNQAEARERKYLKSPPGVCERPPFPQGPQQRP